MRKYQFITDFTTPNSEVPLFKKGEVIEHDETMMPAGGRTDGIYYIKKGDTSSSVVFIPFTYLSAMPSDSTFKKSSVPYIVMGILVIGFISYKLYKKYN
jgi:hypothetical protein